MFTGIITEKGELKDVRRKAGSMVLRIRAPETARDAEPGDSVAVDGVCLTVTGAEGDTISMDVGEETYRRTTLSRREVSGHVNLEPALRVGGKVGGHIVSGHVDATGNITSIKKKTTEIAIDIRFPRELARYIAPKGSICVDGISLTVGEVDSYVFTVHIIPHTLENTTLKGKAAGDVVNLEVDVLARYVVNALEAGEGSGPDLLDKLVEFGYSKARKNA